MIAGFNTDVEHGGTVYHIQTEDKGLSSQMIVSLVYDRGTILASKRTTYDDLVAGDVDEKALAERVSRQHKLICAAIKAGRIGELQEMTGKVNQPPKTETAPGAVPIGRVETQRIITVTAPDPPQRPAADGPVVPDIDIAGVIPVSAPVFKVEPKVEVVDPFADAPMFDEVSIIEEAVELPAEAVAVVSDLSGTERPVNSKLSLELIGETKFKGGDRSTINILICRGSERKVVHGAQIMVKVLGSSFRPVIFHATSDENGLAKVHLQLPHFQAGRAALLVRVISDGQEVELRRIVTPG